MHIYDVIEWAKESSIHSYGEHSAFAECHKYLRERMDAGIEEAKIIIDVEPSDAERLEWTDNTKRYVESLEIIVDEVLQGKLFSGNT